MNDLGLLPHFLIVKNINTGLVNIIIAQQNNLKKINQQTKKRGERNTGNANEI